MTEEINTNEETQTESPVLSRREKKILELKKQIEEWDVERVGFGGLRRLEMQLKQFTK